MGGHAKCLLLMTREEGGGQKSQKPAYLDNLNDLIYTLHVGMCVSVPACHTTSAQVCSAKKLQFKAAVSQAVWAEPLWTDFLDFVQKC